MAKPKKPAKRPAHRPSKYTVELGAKLCAAIGAGSTVEKACRRCGLAPSTFYEWHHAFPEFSDAVLRAKDARLVAIEERWTEATEKDWRAAEAMLKVLKSSRFANRLHIELEGELRGALERLKRSGLDPTSLEKALAAVVGEDDGSPPATTTG